LWDQIWAEVALTGEMDASLMRFNAIRSGIEEAASRCIQPRRSHYHQAEQQISIDHGYHNWTELESAFSHAPGMLSLIREYRSELTAAKAAREYWFTPFPG